MLSPPRLPLRTLVAFHSRLQKHVARNIPWSNSLYRTVFACVHTLSPCGTNHQLNVRSSVITNPLVVAPHYVTLPQNVPCHLHFLSFCPKCCTRASPTNPLQYSFRKTYLLLLGVIAGSTYLCALPHVIQTASSPLQALPIEQICTHDQRCLRKTK